MTSTTDNRTTELLRKLLEERGLSCQTHYLHASWRVGQKLYGAVDNLDGTLTVDNLTPEQAIAATLGNSRAERTCRILENFELPYAICSECGAIQPDDFTVYYCWACGAKVVGE